MSSFLRLLSACISVFTAAGWLRVADPGDDSEKTTVSVTRSETTLHFHARRATLSDVLEAVSKGLGQSVIADVPARQERLDLDVEGSADDVLNAVTSKLDLLWSRSGRILLFRQAFAQSVAGPQLNLHEMRETSRDVCRLLAAVTSTLEEAQVPNSLSALVRSLTSDQVNRLRAGQSISVSTLTPEQIQILQKAMFSCNLGLPAQAWEELRSELDRISNSHFEVRESPRFYNKRAGAKPEVPPNVVPEWQLTWVDQYAPFREYLYVIPVAPPDAAIPASDAPLKQSVAQPELGGRASDASTTEAAPRTTPNLGIKITCRPIQSTVEELAKSLSRLSGATIEASTAISDRQVFFALRDLPLRDVLNALTELDGWMWTQGASGRISISRRRIPVPRSATEIPESLRACFPPELLQFLGAGKSVDRLAGVEDPKLLNYFKALRRDPFYDRHVIVTMGLRLTSTLKRAAEDRLKGIATADTYDGRKVPFESVPTPQRDAVVALLSLQALSSLIKIDAGYLTGSLTPIQEDIRNATIRVNTEGGLEVESEWVKDGVRIKTGFGGGLDPELSNLLRPDKPR
jgi:hypothetical protein